MCVNPQNKSALAFKSAFTEFRQFILWTYPAVIVVFDSSSVIIGAPSAAEIGLSLKASWRCEVVHLLLQTFFPKITGSAFFHLMNDANGHSHFSEI